jgi:hypothetical protein
VPSTTSNRACRWGTRPGVVAVRALTLTLLAGCGASGSADGPAGSAPQARAGTASSGEARLDAVAFTARLGEAMRAKGTTTVTSTGLLPMTVHLRMTSTRVDLEASAGTGPTAWRMIVVDGATYVHVGAPVKGRHWTKLDPTRGSSALKGAAGSLAQWSDPAAALAGLTDEVFAVKGGSEGIDGVRTTKYTVSLTTEQLAKVAQARPGEASASVPAGLSTVTHYYVDDAWLPRRVVTETSLPQEQVPPATLTYRDWGGPVTITAPDPSDVREGPAE